MNNIKPFAIFVLFSTLGSVLYPFANYSIDYEEDSIPILIKDLGVNLLFLFGAYTFRIIGSYLVQEKLQNFIQQLIWVLLNMISVVLYTYYKNEKIENSSLLSLFLISLV